MRKILVPTDFSTNAFNALNFALHLFKEDPTTIILLNAFQLYYFTTDSLLVPEPGEPSYDKAQKISESGLSELKNEIETRPDCEAHHFETISSYNSVLKAVEEAIANHNVDYVIMGTKGDNSEEAKLYGSNAVTLIENIKKCPVLIIPEQTPYLDDGRKEIVLATNYKTTYKLGEMSYLKEIAQKYHAAIRILYIKENKQISEEQLENKQLLQEYLKEVVHTFHVLNDIKVLPGIRSFIESRDSNMLVLVDKKHSFLNSIFSKSILKEIGYKPKVPILVLHDSKF